MATASQQKETDTTTPRKVIVKTMTVKRSADTVFEFLKMSRTWKLEEF